VAGAQLWFLHRKAKMRVRRQIRLHLLAAVADDQRDCCRPQRVCGAKHMVDKRVTGNTVEDLRYVGLHPSTFPGGENDNVKVRHSC
jgi:hypothetical protein